MEPLFDVVHRLEDVEAMLLPGVTREEAVTLVEEYVAPGYFSGRRFEKVALHRYRSIDGRAEIIISRVR